MNLEPNERSKLASFLRHNRMDHESFPHHNVDYYDRFKRLDQKLNSQIHPTINQGAATAAASGGGWLTDHGVQHITTVIRRADELASSGDSIILTPYEAYLLLLAIHFHDVGNIFGRDQHEKNIGKVMQDLDESLIGRDGLEKRIIRDIAMAHGGYVDLEQTNKDTIGSLAWENVRDAHPRARLLAALLRFADELADDHTRTSRFLVNNAPLQGSEVYHLYADRLQRVTVDSNNRRVSLLFELDATHTMKKYAKGSCTVYLYDEIIARTLKMHREHIYCLRFMQPLVQIDTIDVSIVITTDNFMTVLKEINFSLIQRGYPDRPSSLSEIDVSPAIGALTGETLDKEISEIGSDGSI